jgi:hypothetical protein
MMADFVITGFSEGTYSWRDFLVSNIGSATGEYGIPFSLLPHVIAPVQEQVQLAVNATLYTYWPHGASTDAPTNYYTVTPEEAVTTGVPCWGVRFAFTAVNGTAEVAEIRIWDHNGDLIPLEDDWFDVAQDGTNDATNGAKYLDADRTSHVDDNAIDIRFPRQYAVSKVGWTDSDSASSNDYADDITVSLNVGTWATESWSVMATATGQDGAYPTWHPTFDPDLDMLYLEPSDGSLTEGGTVGPYFTLATPLTTATDRVTMWRETRQSSPWVDPQPGAKFRSYDWYWLCKQMLFIYQDISEIEDLAGYTESPIWRDGEYDYSQGQQTQYHLDPASSATFSVDQIDLLEGIPSALEDGDAQLIVELGEATDGSSTYWTVQTGWTHDPAAKTITLAGATTNDVRIRRSTKIDDLWFDSEDLDPNNFTIGVIRMMLTQVVFLSEEGLILPFFDPTSVLGNTHFPRAWNWLRYVWSGSNPTFGGNWQDDPVVIVWKNFIKLTPPTDYYLSPWFKLVWPTEPTDGDTIDVRWGNPMWMTSTFSGLEDPNNPVDKNAAPGEPDFPPDLPISGYDLSIQPVNCVSLANAGLANTTNVIEINGYFGANYLDNLANDYTHGIVFNMGRVNLSLYTSAYLSLVPCLQTAADWGVAGHYDGYVDWFKRGDWLAKDVSWNNYDHSGVNAWATSGARDGTLDYESSDSVAWNLNKDSQATHTLTRFPTDQLGGGNVRIYSPDIMALLVAAKASNQRVALRWRMKNDHANNTIYFAARWDEFTGTAEQYSNYDQSDAPLLLFVK